MPSAALINCMMRLHRRSVISCKAAAADLNQVMIAVEKADVSFQLMMQVRNKIVSAYQDIEKMQF